MSSRAALGRRGEAMVAALLEERGFVVLGQNVRVGRLELDVIAERGGLIVFVEVRTRRTDAFGAPAESIDPRKQARIRRAAATWLSAQSAHRGKKVRFDAAGVLMRRGEAPEIDYYPDAF